MLERGKLYDIETKNHELFTAIFLGSYYKVSSSNHNKTANKTYDFITKEGKFISKDFSVISKANKLDDEINESLNSLINKYEEIYWKKLENTFLVSKIMKESISFTDELDNLSKQIKIANNHFSLKDLMNEQWLMVDDITTKFKLQHEQLSLSCKISKFISHEEINNCSLNCFEIDTDSLNSFIVKDIDYKIKDIKTANRLYCLKMSDSIIEKLNNDLKYFALSYNSDLNNISITNKFVCMDNLINITFNKYEYEYDDYIEMKDDLNYCMEVISEYLEEQLQEIKLTLKEVVYGVEQEIEYENQGYGFGLLDLFNINIPNPSFSNCYC